MWLFLQMFLDASTDLCKRVCPSVRWLVSSLVGPSVVVLAFFSITEIDKSDKSDKSNKPANLANLTYLSAS